MLPVCKRKAPAELRLLQRTRAQWGWIMSKQREVTYQQDTDVLTEREAMYWFDRK